MVIVIYCDPSSTHIQHCSKHNSKYPNKSMENLKISYLLKKEKTYSFICKTLLERGRGKGRQTDLPYFSSLSNSQGCSQELHHSLLHWRRAQTLKTSSTTSPETLAGSETGSEAPRTQTEACIGHWCCSTAQCWQPNDPLLSGLFIKNIC